MDIKILVKPLLIASLAMGIFVSCGDDDNPVGPDPEPEPEEQHPYADDIVENGVIISGPIDGDRTFSADSVYYLDGYVFVESGTLTIEPGTVVMAFETPSSVAEGNETSLIITRNAQIDAQGTPENPIIFTSEFDEEPLGGSITLDETNSKLWAGIIMLGNAPAYTNGNTDSIQIEGIVDPDERSQYGGDEENHSSGIMRYVSIRFTGAEIGPGDEIQGLTLGGVGAGTTLEYIDIFVSADDGIEIFGGTVDIRHISVAFSEDDSFDFDLGWTGTGQYLFAMQGGNDADKTAEWDGASPDNAPLYSNARLYNMTLLGTGYNATFPGDGNPTVIMRDGSAYSIYNSIIAEANGLGIEIEDRGESEDSFDKTVLDVNGDGAAVAGNIWYTGNATSIETMIHVTDHPDVHDADGSQIAAWLTNLGNVFEDPELGGVCRTQGCGVLNPVPASASATTIAATVADSNVDQTTYVGAFEPGQPLWISGWTTLARYGYLAD
ncbi:hypothetical protein [Rhodohalobacter halophilus]|uniref:hypothetical protein n=1 Tax=Rhodohalobacter halophilus TaxID=1812810 RepID=UPI00083F6015|nr:hypothetical protein [Rhodohalobacter halophilus]